MKIRKVTPDLQPKATALLRNAFPRSNYEMRLVENLHKNGKELHEWVCIHTNKVVAYIAFSRAYNGAEVCGLHLAPLAVKPEFQRQGIASELLRFALRQDVVKSQTLFVLGDPGFYKKFGFEPCAIPVCPFDKKNAHFLSIRNSASAPFTVGYEAEFSIGA
jgi:putative acetyltransferase